MFCCVAVLRILTQFSLLLFGILTNMDMLSYPLDYNQTLHICLAVNVTNVQTVMKSIMQGDLQCALIKPKLILDVFQVIVAANRAVVARNNGKLVSRSIYTEVLFNLSPSKNIKGALEEFGVKEDSDFLICVIGNQGPDSAKVAEDICNSIKGTIKFPSSYELKNFCDECAIAKRYNITADELNASDLLSSVVTKIASKGFK